MKDNQYYFDILDDWNIASSKTTQDVGTALDLLKEEGLTHQEAMVKVVHWVEYLEAKRTIEKTIFN